MLEPFRAVFYGHSAGRLSDLIFVPGEQNAGPLPRYHIRLLAEGEPMKALLERGILRQDTAKALFVYRQRFCFGGDETANVREGLVGLLGDAGENAVLRHEHTFAERRLACEKELGRTGANLSSLWLACDDVDRRMESLLCDAACERPWLEVTDGSHCVHQLWRVVNPARIEAAQGALEGKELFLVDGHHRFAANWRLATVQIRTEALRTSKLPESVPHIVDCARQGLLLPPKSTDFYPKLAEGLVISWHEGHLLKS